ncbi:hypothetical protein DM02DRAFT_342395 [Periconia macrospinosa]|uniref:BZIP domain-containing protein n=1 Tax=Periconia macrospinosa TaxID=97972 RepID=A0A2V1D1S8_9PLEO|nr:hypothetical protein DM02DRAFT_342395 [Periconia macrospinosa]
MAMELQSNHFGGAEWANDAFTALSPVDLHSDKWSTFDNPSFVNSSFTIPPSLFTQGSVERFGQVTPPEELSPPAAAAPPPPFREARHTSIPVEELMNEALFPDHQLQALQDFQPPQQQQQQQKGQQIASDDVSLPQKQQSDQGRATKRRRTSRNPSSASQASATNHMSTDPSTTQAPSDNPQPPKRNR